MTPRNWLAGSLAGWLAGQLASRQDRQARQARLRVQGLTIENPRAQKCNAYACFLQHSPGDTTKKQPDAAFTNMVNRSGPEHLFKILDAAFLDVPKTRYAAYTFVAHWPFGKFLVLKTSHQIKM